MPFSQSREAKIAGPKIERKSKSNHVNQNWYIFYTAPRAEKKAKFELELRGFEVFLPMIKTTRIWKNRQKKQIDIVLFPSYIFVKTSEKCLDEICRINKITMYIHCGGKPSKVSSECVEAIKCMLSLNKEISVGNDFIEGETVRIVEGPLAGYDGVLVEQKSKTKFGIHLKEINQVASIEICTNVLEKVRIKSL
ncbi:UpxY family transcription antiterminator [Kordia sp.]|uniref:UpxY family transcription antiterminator n=1 Tax=Kordia sp. TaxID=1965332 RepID=UPI0025BF52D3|nr:UpxY family transcription antiterminator [Kordia sp.]MCH2193522.1 UpxY family transcription antiterminator [Kordia sp.]